MNREELIKEATRLSKNVDATHRIFLKSGIPEAVTRYNSEMNSLGRLYGEHGLTREVTDFNMLKLGKKKYESVPDHVLARYVADLTRIKGKDSDIKGLAKFKEILKLRREREKDSIQSSLGYTVENDEQLKTFYNYVDALRDSGINFANSDQVFEYAMDIITAPVPKDRLNQIKDDYRAKENRDRDITASTGEDYRSRNRNTRLRGNPRRG